jgi:dTDP-glucose 4,6-dehydratase
MKTYQATILVTGGCGSIGSAFISHLLKRGDLRVINVDALTYAGNPENVAMHSKNPHYIFKKDDITNSIALARIFDEYMPEYVINFAAETHVDRSVHLGAKIFLRTNTEGVLNLLEQVKRTGAKKYLQVSTDEVYGSLPLGSKSTFTEASPLRPNSPYAASKAAGDLLCRAYFETWQVPVVVTRCSNNFGPYHNPEKLIPFLTLRALQGKTLPVYGSGLNVRDWIHVDDHCSALALALFNGKPGEIYNIGSNGEKTNLEIAKKIAQHFKLGATAIQFVADRPGHDERYAIDASKIKKELGWKPMGNFDTVFKQTIEWYGSHLDWARRVFERSGIFHPHVELFSRKKRK